MRGRVQGNPQPRPQSWVRHKEQPCIINRWTHPHVSTNLKDYQRAVWTHNGCACNQLVALKYRHQLATPPMTVEPDFTIYDRFRPIEFLQPLTRPQVISNYSGAWRKKYQRAYETYQ